ncbi:MULTISPECIES: hypothetical protein [unclassified Streptomyces]|uniref:hypothetical protein n=1 Tax=unclassified Streptomyces TaxID=2593676 RepID=UPI00081B637D|nr:MULTISPECIES: hypothetical protein [unclassified Streptomyces]MYQ88086.1 hypothetical protein [Streptomyces sp. SID4936]SCE52329.1 hypothetical protein GA0115234_1104142 [Streptomyces sp. DvalAA-43]
MMSSQNASAVRSAGTARPDRLLRTALVADVVLTGANGIGYLVLATLLDSFLGVPRSVQYPVGVFLTVYALWVLTVARQENIGRGAVAVIIALNTAWAVASVVAVVVDALTATGVGNGWIVFQGLVVAAMGALQYAGLRRL